MRCIARWLVLGAFSFLAVSGCGERVEMDDIIGVWETTSVNGYSLPGTVVMESRSYDAQYFRWTFLDGGVCSVAVHIDGDVGSDGCSYAVDTGEQTIAISLSTWDMQLQGPVDAEQMTLTDSEEVPYVLQRQ